MTIMDFDDNLEQIDTTELREMCMMSLNDLEPDEAAKVVLTRLFPDESQGKIKQLSHDMPDDRLWEECSDCLYHERLFSAYAFGLRTFSSLIILKQYPMPMRMNKSQLLKIMIILGALKNIML
jgi:hypothetical protein